MTDNIPLTENEIALAFGWDVVNWSAALNLWLPFLESPTPGKWLEVGGREGGLSFLAAHFGHAVVCSDLENPESIAGTIHNKISFPGSISYASVDALNMGFDSEFDALLFKSILGGIGRDNHPELQLQAIEQMHRALKPGGVLLFAENLKGSAIHRALRQRFQPWGRSWRYFEKKELETMLEKYFSEVKTSTTGILGTLGRSEFQRSILGKLDQRFLVRVCPSTWNYIAYGYAIKS